MNTRFLGNIAAMSILFLGAPAKAEHFQLFVLTGQSNSLGTTAGDDFDPATEKDPGDQEVLLFWDNLADEKTALGNSSEEFMTMRAQQGGVYAGCAIHWGPEIGFGRTLHRSGLRNVAIIKASRGGGGNGLWSKKLGGHMYDHLVQTVRVATESLARQGHTFELSALLYLQGESDSPEEAEVAGVRIQELLENLRADLPEAQKMQAIIGGVAAEGETRDLVRNKQSSLAENSSDVSYFDTSDLRGHLYDGLHFDRDAKKIVGERYATALLESTPNGVKR